MPDPSLSSLQLRKRRLLADLADLGDMRPGSLSSLSRRCGKPSCQCHSPGGKLHGPYWSLTFKRHGKTVTRAVRPQQLATVRQQIANFRRFQALSAELVEVNEQLCQTRLSQASDAEQAKKKR